MSRFRVALSHDVRHKGKAVFDLDTRRCTCKL
jgi:hypothetical protein